MESSKLHHNSYITYNIYYITYDPLCKFISTANDPAGSWLYGTGRTGAPNGTGNADFYIGGVSGTDTVHPNDAGSFYLARRAAAGCRNALMQIAA